MWDGVAWKQVSHPQERRGVSRESLGRGGSKGVATQAWNHPLIQEVEEGGGQGLRNMQRLPTLLPGRYWRTSLRSPGQRT